MWDDSSVAMVNPVNCVGVMGAGIALQFKKSFPVMYALYKVGCANRWLLPGDVLIYQNQSRTVLNVATKGHYKYNSKMLYIKDIVKNLNTAQTVIGNQIAMPKIGCGNGGLKWESVAYELGHLTYENVNVYTTMFETRPQPITFFNSVLILHDGQVYDPYTEKEYDNAVDYLNSEFHDVSNNVRNVEKNRILA